MKFNTTLPPSLPSHTVEAGKLSVELLISLKFVTYKEKRSCYMKLTRVKLLHRNFPRKCIHLGAWENYANNFRDSSVWHTDSVGNS